MKAADDLKRIVRQAVRNAPARDLRTRLTPRAVFAPSGIDALFSSPALCREAGETDPERVFRRLFLDRTPVSFAAQGALWSLRRLGLSLEDRDFARLRAVWDAVPPGMRAIASLDAANLGMATVSVGLFDDPPGEAENPFLLDDRFRAAVRADALLDERAAWGRFSDAKAAREALQMRAKESDAVSVEITAVPDTLFARRMLEDCLRPACAALSLPLVVAGETIPEGPPDAAALAMRLAREGLSFRPFASGASCPEALPGLWEQARRAVAEALAARWQPLEKAGWRAEAAEIELDARALLA